MMDKCVIKRLLMLFLGTLSTVSAFSQISVGVKNNRYVYGEYLLKNHYEAGIEVSVFSEKLGFQYARGRVGYTNSFGNFSADGKAYYGSAFNRSFYDAGASAHAKFTVKERVFVGATLNPHYDSGYGYTTCYEAGLGVNITPEIDIFANYTTIPEYRMSEKRIHLGLDFKVDNLRVSPILSAGTSASDGGKNVRVLVNFNYKFTSK